MIHPDRQQKTSENPIDPEREDRDWIPQTWKGLVIEALGGPCLRPPWSDTPAMMQSTITTPALLRRFAETNRGKSYADRAKPFSFLLCATVAPIDRPPLDRKIQGFQLVAPYSCNPSEWKDLPWMDLHSGKTFAIRTNDPSDPVAIRVQTHADVLDRFRNHPEAKSTGPGGDPSDARTVGLLGRTPVHVLTVFHIGKETNLLEQQEEGVALVDPQATYIGTGEWEAIRARLQSVSLAELSELSGVSQRMLRDLRQGTRLPSAATLEAIEAALSTLLM